MTDDTGDPGEHEQDGKETRRSVMWKTATGASLLGLGTGVATAEHDETETPTPEETETESPDEAPPGSQIECNWLETSELDSDDPTGPPLPSEVSLPGDNDERAYEQWWFEIEQEKDVTIAMYGSEGSVNQEMVTETGTPVETEETTETETADDDDPTAANTFLVIRQRESGEWTTLEYDDDSGPGDTALIRMGRLPAGRYQIIATQYQTPGTANNFWDDSVSMTEYGLVLNCRPP